MRFFINIFMLIVFGYGFYSPVVNAADAIPVCWKMNRTSYVFVMDVDKVNNSNWNASGYIIGTAPPQFVSGTIVKLGNNARQWQLWSPWNGGSPLTASVSSQWTNYNGAGAHNTIYFMSDGRVIQRSGTLTRTSQNCDWPFGVNIPQD